MRARAKAGVAPMKATSFKDAIAKTVKLLTRDQVRVEFRGYQPKVITQGDKVLRMVLPEINDNASEDLVEAMQGFLDHECGHIFFTPFARAAQFHKGNDLVAVLLNIVADIRLEKLLPRELPGTKDNLERMYEAVMDKFFAKGINAVLAQNPVDPQLAMQATIVPGFRAMAGQKAFQRFMDDNNHWQWLTPLTSRMPTLSRDLQSMETYEDVERIVRMILDAMDPQQKKAAEDAAAAAQQQQQDDDDDAPPQKQSGGCDSDDEGEPSDEQDEDADEGDGAGGDEESDEEGDEQNGGDAGDDEGNSSEGDDADEGAGGDSDEDDRGDDDSPSDKSDKKEKKDKGGKGHGDGDGEDDGSDEEGGKCGSDEPGGDDNGQGDPSDDLDGDDEDDGDDSDDDGDGSGGGKRNRNITDAVKSLEATQRRVLYLHKQKRRSVERIAQHMNMSEDEVKATLRDARRNLAEYMTGSK